MAVHLVTGYAGVGHVTSADIGLFNAGVCGLDRYVLKTGTKFAYSLESNNLIRIGSGDLVDQGRHISIPTNTTIDVEIENGTQGKKRIDLIVMRYSKDASTSVESADIEIIKGTETSGTPVRPACTTGNIFAGALVDDTPLYQVTLEGLAVTGVQALFSVVDPLSDMKAAILNAAYPIGAVYISVNSTSPATLFGGTWERIQGRFLLGASGSYSAGSTGGEASHTLTAAEMPSHTHAGPNHNHSIPNHTHTVPAHTHTASTASAGAHTHTLHRWQAGASGTARWAAQGDSSSPTYNTDSAGAHTHTVTVNSKAAFATQNGGAGNTGNSGTGNTGSAGSGGAHNNMPPYLSVYMWKRTA